MGRLTAGLEVVGWLTAGLEVVGRLTAGLEVVGRLTVGLEVVGRLTAELEVVGRLTVGLEVVGRLTAGLEVVGRLTAGLEVVGRLTAELEVVGRLTVGLEVVGRLTVGLEVVGRLTVGLEVVGGLTAGPGIADTVLAAGLGAVEGPTASVAVSSSLSVAAGLLLATESSKCTGITAALPPITASKISKYGKSTGWSASSSDSRPALLLLIRSVTDLYFFLRALIFDRLGNVHRPLEPTAFQVIGNLEVEYRAKRGLVCAHRPVTGKLVLEKMVLGSNFFHRKYWSPDQNFLRSYPENFGPFKQGDTILETASYVCIIQGRL